MRSSSIVVLHGKGRTSELKRSTRCTSSAVSIRSGITTLSGLTDRSKKGREETAIGAHCNTKGFSRQSYNRHSIGICYVGGLDKNGKAKDTRTNAQKKSLIDLINDICRRYPIVELLGHRDTSPDLNDNGEVEPAEYIKTCPCFDVRSEYGLLKKDVIITP